MKITYDEKSRVFSIETQNSGYYIAIVDEENFVSHLHYGKKIDAKENVAALTRTAEPPFVPSKNNGERLSFYDAFLWEYPCGGTGDFRESCLEVCNQKNQNAAALHYKSHEIISGKPKIAGLPATFSAVNAEGTSSAGEKNCFEDCKTLVLHCVDEVLQMQVDLHYSIFEGIDAVARHAEIFNKGKNPLVIKKALSACLELDNENFDFVSLNGSWARERHIERTPLLHGKMCASSRRGETSHQQNNFVALASRNATHSGGQVYGTALVYSGNFLSLAELNQFDYVRLAAGINPADFEWRLEAGESFSTPEAVFVYSCEGFNKMSQCFHDLWRDHLIRGKFKNSERPVLINNWEGTFFDFDSEKLLAIARDAAKCGIEMLVMDDGWFGKRNRDNSSLGDWFVNEEKLKGGLENLVQKVNALGMKFGIWFEPEMISPQSELYKSHPEWAIAVEGREPAQGRNQLVLDMGRKDVRDCIWNQMKKILQSANIEYVKWDMNRPLSDLGSAVLQKENSGELCHRYMLGVYEMQERLVTEFPNVLLENCSGGGGRFDAGMLHYSPQIWCSDDTDAVERLAIQAGTALCYPLSSMGAHISISPSQAAGRILPFRTRGFVALAGTFGYEIDITKMPSEEKNLIFEQIEMYKKHSRLVREGDYFRIACERENERDFDAWQIVSKDKGESLLTVIQVLCRPNFHSRKIKLLGLEENARYAASAENSNGEKIDLGLWSGKTLCNAGLVLPRMWGDFQGQLVWLRRV